MTSLEELALRIVNAIAPATVPGDNKDRAEIETEALRQQRSNRPFASPFYRKVAQTRFVARLLERQQAEVLLWRNQEEASRRGYLEREIFRLGDELLNAEVRGEELTRALEWYLARDREMKAAGFLDSVEDRPAFQVLGKEPAASGEGSCDG